MKAQDFFQQYPDKDVCYETTDGNLFFLQCDAVNHSRTLEESKVVEHTRTSQEVAVTQAAVEVLRGLDEEQQEEVKKQVAKSDKKSKKPKSKK